MTTGLDAIAAFVQPLYGLPCWGAKGACTSNAFPDLRFEFGEPKLAIRESRPWLLRNQSSWRRSSVHRSVHVSGAWGLYVPFNDWLICQDGKAIATARAFVSRPERAVRELRGQALSNITVTPDGRRAEFQFDLGGRLIVVARDRARRVTPDMDPDERAWMLGPHEMWRLRGPDGRYGHLRDDGRYTINPGNVVPEQAVWLPLSEGDSAWTGSTRARRLSDSN